MDKQFIESIPIPVCIVDTEGCVKASNDRVNKVFPYEDIDGYKFFALTGVKRDQLLNANSEEIIIDRNEKRFKLWTNTDVNADEDITVLFDEVSGREAYRSRLEKERAAIVLISIDNYDELIASAPEDYKRVIPSQIDGILRKWGNSFNSPILSTDEDRYAMYTNRESINKMADDNFSVLEEVRAIEPTIDFPISISIGAGISDESIMETQELAESALELALGRGGDQAVIKNDEGTEYYGGSLQTLEKSNRGRSRVIAHALKGLINDADKVFIMGHHWPDMDAFGSAIGASCMCSFLGKEPYIVIDKHNDALDTVYNRVVDTDEYNIIKPEKALKMVTDKSLLIIVDTNRPYLVESPELVEACSTKVIIDHHRLTDDSYRNVAIAYIESYASSASELMAEMLQHISQKRFINKLEAECMLAGIMVDSNNFSGRTGVRTFEAASWLKRGGADTTEVKKFFQINQDDFITRANAIVGAEFTEDGVAYATTDGITSNMAIINAQVADELMTVKGMKATFALGRNEKGQTIVSARSLGEINVQTIMEKLGGGGHFTSAAAQTDQPRAEVLAQLKKLVNEYIEREEEERKRTLSKTMEIELIR